MSKPYDKIADGREPSWFTSMSALPHAYCTATMNTERTWEILESGEVQQEPGPCVC